MTPNLHPEAELNQVYGQMRGALKHYLQRQLNDASMAEDLVQDVFFKALKAIREDRAPRDLPAWLYRAARTTLIDFWRTHPPRGDVSAEELPTHEEEDAVLLHQKLATCLRPMAERLPAHYRDALLAADFDGRKLKALAEEQGVSLSAIKSRVSRGRGLLREQVLECCHVETGAGWVQDYYPHPRSHPETEPSPSTPKGPSRCGNRKNGC